MSVWRTDKAMLKQQIKLEKKLWLKNAEGKQQLRRNSDQQFADNTSIRNRRTWMKKV